jgi:hypothetical protein
LVFVAFSVAEEVDEPGVEGVDGAHRLIDGADAGKLGSGSVFQEEINFKNLLLLLHLLLRIYFFSSTQYVYT